MSVILSERTSNRKRSKNASTNSQNEQEDLISKEPEDFISKEEREVIKVPNCSYSNEAKSMYLFMQVNVQLTLKMHIIVLYI